MQLAAWFIALSAIAFGIIFGEDDPRSHHEREITSGKIRS
jgi:hypothetical protein